MREVSVIAFGLTALALPQAVVAQTTIHIQREPSAWFGVMLSDEALLNQSGKAFFDRYPVVRTVEPGSPAAKAGVKPGDVLMTFNSQDMRGAAFQLRNSLKVGAPFELRLRRNDEIQTVRGVLTRRPDNWEELTIVQLSPSEQMTTQGVTGQGGLSRATVRVRSAGMGLPPRLPSVLVPALGLGGGLYPFAGAEFTALNDDLSEILGVRPEGVFVTNVMEGSIARESGLRGGDVVVMADSIKIISPNDLVRAIRTADDRSVRLEIIRKRKPQTLTLRW